MKNLLAKALLVSIIFTSSLFSNFIDYSTEKMQTAIKENITIIDIRRLDEWKKYGIIKNSHTLTFFDGRGKYDIEKWMSKFTKIVKSKNQPFVLVCAHANRTKMVGEFLSKKMGYKTVRDLKGGIMYGWIDKGLKTVSYKK